MCLFLFPGFLPVLYFCFSLFLPLYFSFLPVLGLCYFMYLWLCVGHSLCFHNLPFYLINKSLPISKMGQKNLLEIIRNKYVSNSTSQNRLLR
jgi:hypothetical protein